jgi:hypothetical protein
MDITQFFPVPATLNIEGPFGEPTDIKFEVLSLDNERSAKAFRKIGSMIMANRTPDQEEVHQINVEAYAACIVGWSGLTENGVEIPYSPEKALEMMRDDRLSFLRAQVERFAAQRANFFRSNSKAA